MVWSPRIWAAVNCLCGWVFFSWTHYCTSTRDEALFDEWWWEDAEDEWTRKMTTTKLESVGAKIHLYIYTVVWAESCKWKSDVNGWTCNLSVRNAHCTIISQRVFDCYQAPYIIISVESFIHFFCGFFRPRTQLPVVEVEAEVVYVKYISNALRTWTSWSRFHELCNRHH